MSVNGTSFSGPLLVGLWFFGALCFLGGWIPFLTICQLVRQLQGLVGIKVAKRMWYHLKGISTEMIAVSKYSSLRVVPGLGGLKETKMFLPHPRVKVSIVGSLRDREVACSASDHQGSNFESCVWRTVSSQSSHHPQEVLLAQVSLYVHKGGLKPDSFHFCGRHFPR